MKKLVLFTLLLCLMVTVFVYPTASASGAQTSQTEQLLIEFVTSCPIRAASMVEKVDVSKWIADKFLQLGVDGVAYYEIDDVLYGRNVVATIDAPNTNKMVVIGAHYDTAKATCVGANDNASGVVALFQIANYLAQNKDQLNFDVCLVAFDAEELGLLGSYDYVQDLTEQQKLDVALMINIDSIAAGDNLYVYCENKNTPLLQQFLASSQTCQEKLYAKPFTKGVFSMIDMWGYGYWEMAQNSDHTPFRLEGIPTACFFSGNYKSKYYGYVQSSNEDSWTLNASDDTLENLVKYAPQYAQKIDAVTYVVCDVVTNDAAVDTVLGARDHLVSSSLMKTTYPTLIAGIILLVATVFVFIHHKKLKKQAILGVAEVKKEQVFTSPDVDDIFKF